MIVALLAMSGNAMALEYEPEAGFTWQGMFGMNLSNFSGTMFDTSIKPGFNLGVRGEYMLPGCAGVFVNGGLNYTMKGAQSDEVPGATLKSRACYVEIPVHVGYRYNISDAVGIYADFGPYFALGINGKSIIDYDDDLLDTQKSRFFRNSNGSFGDIQRFDFGVGYRIGAEYINHHSLTLGMDWGITDMYTGNFRKDYKASTGLTLDQLHNFNVSLTYGYRF